jgi:drug/metabolite transporter (DMT)-like permease
MFAETVIHTCSTNPLWNTLIATFVLGESIKTVGIVGAGLFLSALGIAAITPLEQQESLQIDSGDASEIDTVQAAVGKQQ